MPKSEGLQVHRSGRERSAADKPTMLNNGGVM